MTRIPPAKRATRMLNQQLIELGTVAPQVVGRRLNRMALAGLVPDARDRAEFALMSSEKTRAAWEAWGEMSRTWVTLGSTASAAMWSWWMPWAFPSKALPSAEDSLSKLASAGLRPYVRVAKANNKRLAKGKRAAR